MFASALFSARCEWDFRSKRNELIYNIYNVKFIDNDIKPLLWMGVSFKMEVGNFTMLTSILFFYQINPMISGNLSFTIHTFDKSLNF